MRAETTTNEACRRSSFVREQEFSIEIKELMGPVREKDWNTQDLFMAHYEFQGSTGFRRAGKGGNRVRFGKSRGMSIGK